MVIKNQDLQKRSTSKTAQRWAGYAKAASMGAFALGAASNTDAAIINNGGTHNDGAPVLPIVADPISYGYKNSFDIDGDGLRDFFMGTANYGSVFGQLDGANTAGLILSSAPTAYSVAFAAGATIDGSSDVATDAVAVMYEDLGGGPVGFGDGSRGYMGFKTSLGYFGWMDLSTIEVPDAGFNGIDDLQLTIHGWAYDDTGAGIGAGAIPEPSSLALLAAGSVGLLARRRRKNVA